ncbi:MAG: phosphoglycerate kinase [Candidatus Pacebacteria bacterium]|nr:phosphoglycerate kinase [Candidatus Paceibacterota bacterium]
MYSLKDFNFTNKRVLVRCDFNVPIKYGQVGDDFRIKRSLPTVFYLKRAGAKIILMSHLGRPQEPTRGSLFSSQPLSLKPVKKRLEELVKDKLQFYSKSTGPLLERKVNKMKGGQIILLENLRFNKGEEANDLHLAMQLAKLGDFYINEAFSVCHREHASVALLPKLLPHCPGLELADEVEFLSKIRDNPQRPFTVIIGGAKLDSKMKVIDKFVALADHILFGGDVADVILAVKGICLGCSWPAREVIEKIQYLKITSSKIHLPIDAIISPDRTGKSYTREGAPGTLRYDEEILDIGPETIKKFGEIIKGSATIFWSGPLGLVENERFERGTVEVARILAQNKRALKVLGGGDTVPVLNKHGLMNSFSFISVGGGAMLSFLAREKMPGLAALGFAL